MRLLAEDTRYARDVNSRTAPGVHRTPETAAPTSGRLRRRHRELVALAGSERTDELMRSVFAELRLAFHVVDYPRRLHEPYLARNRQILQALQAGDRPGAEKLLENYLADSLGRVVEVYRRRVGEDDMRLG
jgi:DNA-binding GntR family transcriptional regulator